MDFPVEIDIPGKFSIYNSLTAIAICRHFKVSEENIIKALKVARVKGRIEMIKVSDEFTLMIDYAHNAMALESLLGTLKEYDPHRLVCLFGCGGNRSKLRRYEMGEVSGKMADLTIITSDNPRDEDPQAIIDDIKIGMAKTDGKYVEIPDRKEAIAYAIHHGEPGDIIVLAGKGHEDYQELVQAIKPGVVVTVPFGKGNTLRKGYVTGISGTAKYDASKLKEIRGVSTDSETTESRLIALAAWMKETYGSTMIQALKTVLPVKDKVRAKEKRLILFTGKKEEGQALLGKLEGSRFKARERFLRAILEAGSLDYTYASKELGAGISVLDFFEKKGLITIESQEMYRIPEGFGLVKENMELSLNQEQLLAAEQIFREWQEPDPRPALLFGVTGSGKTQVYMRLIQKVLEEGKQAIVLIPEIALTYQTVRRFYAMFGDKVSVLNSRLSQGERYDQFKRAKRGEIQVMVGPRSALFTPFSDLGLIVIDEEHEPTYKSENTPRYHARETAIERARMEHARVVMGSATPSLEAYSHACDGEYLLVKLNARYEERPLPQVSIVDLREELKKGNRSVLSLELKRDLEQVLERREQAMLFLNRRGYAGFVSCRSCGHVMYL